MPKLIVTTRSGETREIDAAIGVSIMEAIRDSGVDELLALCGGGCACATCHIYLDPAFASIVSPLSEDENELLDGASHRATDSRLSCQIRVNENFSNLRVTIAPQE